MSLVGGGLTGDEDGGGVSRFFSGLAEAMMVWVQVVLIAYGARVDRLQASCCGDRGTDAARSPHSGRRSALLASCHESTRPVCSWAFVSLTCMENTQCTTADIWPAKPDLHPAKPSHMFAARKIGHGVAPPNLTHIRMHRSNSRTHISSTQI